MKRITFFVLALVIATSVWAESKYDIKQMTPEVQSALSSRRDRFEQVKSLKSSGALGENNHGYVDVLSPGNGADEMAAAENRDRKIIYQTIADQNGLENAIGTIETVFAQVQRDKASSGDQIQSEDGHWTAK